MLIERLEQLFDTGVMSVHLSEGTVAKRKRGVPGAWHLEEVGEVWHHEDLRALMDSLTEACATGGQGFVEKATRYSAVLQFGDMRVVMTRPPLSGEHEVTVIRPITTKRLTDYNLPDTLLARLQEKAEGILIAGSPGNGKTTFAEALLEEFHTHGRIIKTIEVPRDLRVPQGVTQYALSHSSLTELRDLLLLTRPDYTFFDEIRNPEDFALFKDLRLTGVGMVGVIHAKEAIDAIQRCIGRIELGLIAHVIDTVIFVEQGKVARVFQLAYGVKVPLGMQDSDLARPVITVTDFLSGDDVYEIYTFGDQVVVMSLADMPGGTAVPPLARMGLQALKRALVTRLPGGFEVSYISPFKVRLHVPTKDMPQVIGKGGSSIRQLEQDMGVAFDVVEKGGASGTQASEPSASPAVSFVVEKGKGGRLLLVPTAKFTKGRLVSDRGEEISVTVTRAGVIVVPKGPFISLVERKKVRLYASR